MVVREIYLGEPPCAHPDMGSCQWHGKRELNRSQSLVLKAENALVCWNRLHPGRAVKLFMKQKDARSMPTAWLRNR